MLMCDFHRLTEPPNAVISIKILFSYNFIASNSSVSLYRSLDFTYSELWSCWINLIHSTTQTGSLYLTEVNLLSADAHRTLISQWELCLPDGALCDHPWYEQSIPEVWMMSHKMKYILSSYIALSELQSLSVYGSDCLPEGDLCVVLLLKESSSCFIC